MEGELLSPYPKLKQVDEHLLERFDELVEGANAEDMAKLLESWSKYVSARKNNDLFQEDPEGERRKGRVSVAKELLRKSI